GTFATSRPATRPGMPGSTSAGTAIERPRPPRSRSTSSTGGPPLGGTYGTGTTTNACPACRTSDVLDETRVTDSENDPGATQTPSSPRSDQHGVTSLPDSPVSAPAHVVPASGRPTRA